MHKSTVQGEHVAWFAFPSSPLLIPSYLGDAGRCLRIQRRSGEEDWSQIVAPWVISGVMINERQCSTLTRAPLGYSAERAPLGGGQILPPLPNSRTNRRSEAGEAAIESAEREDFSAH